MKLNWLQKTVARLFKIIPFDIDTALREQFRAGKAAAEAEKPYVWIDPPMRQRGYEQSAWNSPERNTDIPPALKSPKYVERIRTQFDMPKLPQQPPHKYTLVKQQSYDNFLLTHIDPVHDTALSIPAMWMN